jgi:purine-binding chemotaxis protein CheW
MARTNWEAIYSRLDQVDKTIQAATDIGPERQGEILAERALLLARESKIADNAAEGRLLAIAFQVGDQRFAVEVKDIGEIVTLSQIVRVPCVPDFIAGITNVRGNILTLVDLRRLFGDVGEGIVDLKRAIIVHAHDARLGLLAEEILGTVQYQRSSLQRLGNQRHSDRYVRGVTDDLISLLDIEAIVSDPKVQVDED